MISIIIPTRNEEKVIQDTLQKIKQGVTAVPYELIVSDGKSTDRTVPIAQTLADKVVLEPEGVKDTIAAGKNRGAAAARGEFLLFLDADVEIIDPDKLFSIALARFAADPKLLGITGNLRVTPAAATLADRFFFGLVNLTHRFINNVLRSGSASGEFQMIRRAAFRALTGYREDLAVAEDNDMFARLARIGHTRFVPELTVIHSGRRAHAVGWPRLLLSWLTNALSVKLLKRSADKEWKVIR